MIHHERLRPPSHDYPADEWNVIEKAFHPEFMAQAETMAALGNGYLGMRDARRKAGPMPKTPLLLTGSMKPAQLCTQKTLMASRKLARPS
jgi:alpha,alpha-trehalose phosphorylase